MKSKAGKFGQKNVINELVESFLKCKADDINLSVAIELR